MRTIRTLLAAVAALLGAYGPVAAMDCSGTITTGGTAQTVFTAVVRGVMLMNNSANLMCVAFNGVTASIAGTNCAAGSYVLQPGSATTSGGSFNNPANIGVNQVSIISSTTGDRFSCERQ